MSHDKREILIIKIAFQLGLGGAAQGEALKGFNDTVQHPQIATGMGAVVWERLLAVPYGEWVSEAVTEAYEDDRVVITKKFEDLVGKDAASVLNLNDGGDEARWQGLYWTKQTYAELLETKNKYDRSGLLFCHHCVGSERWDASGTCEVGLNATSIDR